MSQTDQPESQQRRQFVGTAAAVAGLAIAPGVLLYEVAHSKPDDVAVSNRTRWGMLVDSTKCATGCNECVTA
ncbi:MAG: sulfate reduction electron transfer complex DsrMKJOP subunit DsrO, partial [Thiobacillus sp.]